MSVDPGTLGRLIGRLGELEAEIRRAHARLDIYDAWARESERPPAQTGTLLQELQARPAVDRQAIVAALLDQIRSDPQLRELLRGPRGLPGLDGVNGPPGHDGKDIIREVHISG